MEVYIHTVCQFLPFSSWTKSLSTARLVLTIFLGETFAISEYYKMNRQELAIRRHQRCIHSINLTSYHRSILEE